MELKPDGGRALSLSPEILKALDESLKQPEGFEDYEAIRVWLKETYGIELRYSTLSQNGRKKCCWGCSRT